MLNFSNKIELSCLDAGNLERMYEVAPQLMEASNIDYEEAGAWLLGHDMAGLLPHSSQPRLIKLLKRETDVAGRVSLIGDMPINADLGLRLLQNLARGFGIRENT